MFSSFLFIIKYELIIGVKLYVLGCDTESS